MSEPTKHVVIEDKKHQRQWIVDGVIVAVCDSEDEAIALFEASQNSEES